MDKIGVRMDAFGWHVVVRGAAGAQVVGQSATQLFVESVCLISSYIISHQMLLDYVILYYLTAVALLLRCSATITVAAHHCFFVVRCVQPLHIDQTTVPNRRRRGALTQSCCVVAAAAAAPAPLIRVL